MQTLEALAEERGSEEKIWGSMVKQAMKLLVNELTEDDRVAIVTYAGTSGLALPSTPARQRPEILDAIDRSLRRLQMDYVDLYQIHRLDSETPMEEILEALHDLGSGNYAVFVMVDGKPKVKARVTVQFVPAEEGDRAVHIIVRASTPSPKKPAGD